MKTIKFNNISKSILNFEIIIFSVLLILSILKISNKNFVFGSWIEYAEFPIYLTAVIVLIIYRSYPKYFIKWNEKSIYYKLPKERKIIELRFLDIIDVDIRLFEIQITLPNNTNRTLDLKLLNYEELRSVKDRFEKIKTAINKSYSPLGVKQ